MRGEGGREMLSAQLEDEKVFAAGADELKSFSNSNFFFLK